MNASICYFYSIFRISLVDYFVPFDHQMQKALIQPTPADTTLLAVTATVITSTKVLKQVTRRALPSSHVASCSTDVGVIPSHSVVTSGSVTPADQTGSLSTFYNSDSFLSASLFVNSVLTFLENFMFHHLTQRSAHCINSHLVQEHNLIPCRWCVFNTFTASACFCLYALAKPRNISTSSHISENMLKHAAPETENTKFLKKKKEETIHLVTIKKPHTP